jgi:hypothetical protein
MINLEKFKKPKHYTSYHKSMGCEECLEISSFNEGIDECISQLKKDNNIDLNSFKKSHYKEHNSLSSCWHCLTDKSFNEGIDKVIEILQKNGE